MSNRAPIQPANRKNTNPPQHDRLLRHWHTQVQIDNRLDCFSFILTEDKLWGSFRDYIISFRYKLSITDIDRVVSFVILILNRVSIIAVKPESFMCQYSMLNLASKQNITPDHFFPITLQTTLLLARNCGKISFFFLMKYWIFTFMPFTPHNVIILGSPSWNFSVAAATFKINVWHFIITVCGTRLASALTLLSNFCLLYR